MKTKKQLKKEPLLKLDLGCGKNKKQGFWGVDERKFNGVDQVCDLKKKFPWKDNSVEEIHCSHFLEHLTGVERVQFMNEVYRVLIPDGKITLITPHWNSCRAYGDYTHQWPPVSEFWFYYLSKDWRAVNAPHNDLYECNFESSWGYSMHQAIVSRNQEYQQNALQWYKEAAQDICATLIKK